MKIIRFCLSMGLIGSYFAIPIAPLLAHNTAHNTLNGGIVNSAKSDDESAAEPKSSDHDSDQEQSKTILEPLAPEELARLQQLANADQLFLAGDKVAAAKIYREAKEVWQPEKSPEINSQPQPFDDPEQLSPAGQVFWRNYQQGQEQQLETRITSPLKLLTTREPEFILGHIHYAEALHNFERSAEAEAALARAVRLLPNEPQIIQAKIEADIAQEQWLEASILARQFALFNPDAPEAEQFHSLAEEYLLAYQNQLRSSIKWNAIGNAIAGTVGFALTGNLFGPLSALQTSSLLLKGESAVGDSAVDSAKKQLLLLQDEEISAYVNRIGQKIAQNSGREEFDYEFHVVMDDGLNAFALPGGKIFINAGAIIRTDSEAELAGLLAHEISHSALSHGFQLVTRGNLTSNIVSYIPYVGSTASNLLVLNYSRDMEKQADIFGTRILVNSGYAADGVRNLMAKLQAHNQAEDNPEPAAWVSSHPNTQTRIDYMEELIIQQNLNRFAYEGVKQHQEMKYLVAEKWEAFSHCIKQDKVDSIAEAKVCAGETNQSATHKAESEAEEAAAEEDTGASTNEDSAGLDKL